MLRQWDLGTFFRTSNPAFGTLTFFSRIWPLALGPFSQIWPLALGNLGQSFRSRSRTKTKSSRLARIWPSTLGNLGPILQVQVLVTCTNSQGVKTKQNSTISLGLGQIFRPRSSGLAQIPAPLDPNSREAFGLSQGQNGILGTWGRF